VGKQKIIFSVSKYYEDRVTGKLFHVAVQWKRSHARRTWYTDARLIHSVYSRHFWGIPPGGGGFPPVAGDSPGGGDPPRTAAKWRALNLESFFLGWENELQIYHGNFLLMDNKRRQLLVVKQRR